MNPWASASSWQGDGVRRELFFVAAGSDDVYVSLYAASEPREGGPGVVVCPGWGFDMFQFNDLMHSLALGVAQLGGAAVVFHPPGHGDSTGAIEDLTVQGNVDLAVDLAGEAGRRAEGLAWGFAGFRVGAAVATLAASRTDGRLLALIEPALDLPVFFAESERRARRLTLNRAGELSLFGHPLPNRAAAELPETVPMEALDAYTGPAAVIAYAASPPVDVSGRVDRVTVPGKLSNPAKLDEQKDLAAATVEWIRSVVETRVAS